MHQLRNFVDSKVLLILFFPVALWVIFLLVYAKCNSDSVLKSFVGYVFELFALFAFLSFSGCWFAALFSCGLANGFSPLKLSRSDSIFRSLTFDFFSNFSSLLV